MIPVHLPQFNMSIWPSSPALTTVITPLTLLCVILILRLRTTSSRLHAILLTFLFLPIQHFSLFHPIPLAHSALQHRQLIYATIGAILHALAIAVTSAIAYCVLALSGMLLAFLLFANEQRLDPRIRNFFKELSARLNISWTYTTRSTTTTETDGATVSATVTNTEEVQYHPTGEHADFVDKLLYWASFLIPVLVNIPADLVNAATPFVMSPSHTILLMGSPKSLSDVASVFDIIKLATAGSVGLWYTRVLLVSMWTAQTSSTTPPKAVFEALKSVWWFSLGVAAQIYVSANLARRDLFNSGPSLLRVAWLVFQFRLAIRIVEAAQHSLRERSTNVQICLEGVKAFFVTYFGVVCWRVVVRVLTLEAGKYATA